MNDRSEYGDPAAHIDRAREIMEAQLADGLRAIDECKSLTEQLRRSAGMIDLADERVRTLSSGNASIHAERDFYMRYGAALSARLDHIFTGVEKATEEIREFGVTYDEIARMAHSMADKAHNAYLLLSSLQTTIQGAKLDAKDAAFRPKIESGAAEQKQVTDASPMAAGEHSKTDERMPAIIRRGPAIGGLPER